MEKLELEYKPVEEVRAQGNFVKAIGFKPKLAPIIIGAIGILLLLVNNLFVRILGAFCVLMAFFVFKEVKDYKVMDIFDEGIMFYGDADAKYACFIPFEAIKEWNVNRDNGHDTLEFDLGDNKKVFKDTFEAGKAYRVLYQLIKEKEKNYIRAQNSKALSIPETFENIKKKYKNKQ